MSRIFAIGDIHGCLDKLKELMDIIDWRPNRDTLLFIGDYIDRGHDSAGVLDYLIELRKKAYNIVFLKGNHEQLFLDYLDGRNTDLYLINGGHQTLASYENRTGGIPGAHLDFIKSLDLFFETRDYIFVHAGLRDGLRLSEQSPHDLIWIREEFIESDYDHGKRVIFGHTPVIQPLVKSNKIGIDTGAVYGGLLTCLELPDVIFHSV